MFSIFSQKRLFQVRWVSTFPTTTVNHAAFIVARTAKSALSKAKLAYNIAATSTAYATEHGEVYLHKAEVNLIPGAAIAKGTK
jgi:hypothetical protein